MNGTDTELSPSESSRFEGDGFFAASVRRPVTLFVIFLTLIVIGTIAYVEIPLQAMPSGIVQPGLQVFAANPGASAPENERKVTRVLEEQLRTLAGIREIESGSNPDSVWISITFEADLDMELAKAEVRDRIERARPLLPDTVRDIGIWSWSMDQMPIMFFGLLHPGDSARTDYLIDEVIGRRIESVDGVGKLDVWGVLDDSVRIELDEDRVRAANLDLGALIGRLTADNFAKPMGEITDGGSEILLRSDMRFESKAEIESYPIGDGLTLGDIGRVIDAKSVRNSLFRINGLYSYYGEVQKDAQANVVDTCARLARELEALEKDPRLGGEFEFLIFWDQGDFIQSSLGQLKQTALTGGLLAVLILFLFLRRVRLTLCVALSIPISVLLAIAWIYFGGGSFNVLTMTGVTLAMGMLVDNSVVVIENISRLKKSGMDSKRAAVAGVRGVGLAVLLSTMTTVVVFLPLIFMSENPVLRIMFGSLGLPLCAALLFSLSVALVFLPVVAARAVGPRHAGVQRLAESIAPVAALPVRACAWLVGGLRFALFRLTRLAFACNRLLLALLTPLRWPLAAGIVLLIVTKARSSKAALELNRTLRDLDPKGAGVLAEPAGHYLLLFVLPGLIAVGLCLFGMPRWRRRAAGAPARPEHFVLRGSSLVDFLIASNRALVSWSLRHRLAAVSLAALALSSGLIPQNLLEMTAFGEDENTSRVRVRVELENNFTLEQAGAEMAYYEEFFEARRERYGFDNLGAQFDSDSARVSLYWEGHQSKKDYEAVLRDIRENLGAPPGHSIRTTEEQDSGRSKTTVSFRLVGPDSEELERIGARAVKILEGIDGLSSVSSPLESAPRQVRLAFDSDVAQGLGISPTGALQTIAWALRGWQLPDFQESGREIPLIIEYDEEQVAGLDTLRELEVFTGESSVPLMSFSELEFASGARSIRRRNGQTSFTITARVDDPLRQLELSRQGYRELSNALDLPRGYAVGEDDLVDRRQEEEMKEIRAALMLSVVLVFLLMGILFESFMLPFSVLFTIPFAVVGAFWTLYLTGTTMDSVGWIGIIILVGVVVNNGIVLIDRVHRLRATVERSQAVIEGCSQRVRPVVMTAMTTVIGLLPMALREPAGDGIDYRALATCVAGGLTFSTFFTLWVVPLAYTLFDDLARVLLARVRWALRQFGRSTVHRAEPGTSHGASIG
jgi:HAE1 family hydrophobic/amphiphilic exporter-1